jgi:AraC family ethanolamine operon transcriptional activator
MELKTRPGEPVALQGLPGAGSHCVFDDIDAQAESLQGWNQRYQQLSSGQFKGAVKRVHFDGVALFIEDLHQAVHQTGRVQHNVAAFGVPLALEGTSQFCGQSGDIGKLHIFSGRDGFEFHSPKRHLMLGIEVERSLFASCFEHDCHMDCEDFLGKARLLPALPEAIDGLRKSALALFEPVAAMATTEPAASAQVRTRRDALLGQLLQVVGPEPREGAAVHSRVDSAAQQSSLKSRAYELVQSRLDDPPTIAELCEQLGVSRRTLQNCIHENWGMGPLAWVRTLRLNAVRQHLKKRADSVTDAATQFGFWHFGHFAADYRALFGESPSATLGRYRM